MPASTVRCTNPACPHVGQDRRVEMVEAGPGLYAIPALACACGWRPQTVERWSSTEAPAAPERAVKRAPERRGGRRG